MSLKLFRNFKTTQQCVTCSHNKSSILNFSFPIKFNLLLFFRADGGDLGLLSPFAFFTSFGVAFLFSCCEASFALSPRELVFLRGLLAGEESRLLEACEVLLTEAVSDGINMKIRHARSVISEYYRVLSKTCIKKQVVSIKH